MGVVFTRGNRVSCHVCHSSVQNPGCQRLEQTTDNCGPGSAKRLEKRGFDCLTDSFGRVERESHPLCHSQFERGSQSHQSCKGPQLVLRRVVVPAGNVFSLSCAGPL